MCVCVCVCVCEERGAMCYSTQLRVYTSIMSPKARRGVGVRWEGEEYVREMDATVLAICNFLKVSQT